MPIANQATEGGIQVFFGVFEESLMIISSRVGAGTCEIGLQHDRVGN